MAATAVVTIVAIRHDTVDYNMHVLVEQLLAIKYVHACMVHMINNHIIAIAS